MPTDSRTFRNGIQPVFVTVKDTEYALASSKRPGASATIRGQQVVTIATIAATNPTKATHAAPVFPNHLRPLLSTGGDGGWTDILRDRLGCRNVRIEWVAHGVRGDPFQILRQSRNRRGALETPS
jgi:hypothetical protein